ncbi:MAG: zinc-regulated TonB-dependent outer membrane receptor [Deltaproteobacteria bacterium]|nr:zinc-regulated TonB-dependent outer membrane receptor [Deltaproteobacteria bacterium]
MLAFARAAPLLVLSLLSSRSALADDPPSTALTPAEEAAVAAALAEPSSSSSSPPLPDLSQVNLGAAIPGIQGVSPRIAFIFDGSAAWFSVDPPLQTGEHDPSRTGFKLQQLELALGASVDPVFRFDANIVFKTDGVEIEEAYATTTSLPFNLQVRGGQFLTHFGRINEQHPHAWSFLDQPLVMGKLFGGDNNRGLGVEASWLTPLPWFTNVIVTVQEAAGECCARTYAPVDVLELRSPLDLVGTLVVEQFFAAGDDLSILVGLNGQAGPATSVPADRRTGDARAELFGTDLLLRYAPVDAASRWSLSLQTEAFARTRRYDSADDGPGDVLERHNDVDAGGYSQLVWRIDPQWETGARVDVVTGLPDDALDPDWDSLRTRFSAQGSFYPSHFSRLRLEGSVDVPTYVDEPIYALMLQLEVVIGAHGSHAY